MHNNEENAPMALWVGILQFLGLRSNIARFLFHVKRLLGVLETANNGSSPTSMKFVRRP